MHTHTIVEPKKLSAFVRGVFVCVFAWRLDQNLRLCCMDQIESRPKVASLQWENGKYEKQSKNLFVFTNVFVFSLSVSGISSFSIYLHGNRNSMKRFALLAFI